MEANENTCRHQYVKIFQRRYKNYERRLISTRGYLPTGFSNKDFSFLNPGAYCFCTKCRKCLYPTRSQNIKSQNIILPVLSSDIPTPETVDNVWTEEATETNASTSQEIQVEELQLEPTDVGDIVDKEIVVTQQDTTELENEGE